MSIETWKVEFYPVPASEVCAEDALQHSLRKWIGLREENLGKHACFVSTSVVLADGRKEFDLNSSSCALCVSYYTSSDGYKCSSCPIVKLTGMSCDSNKQSPWWAWAAREAPEPMIAVLQDCIAAQAKEKA